MIQNIVTVFATVRRFFSLRFPMRDFHAGYMDLIQMRRKKREDTKFLIYRPVYNFGPNFESEEEKYEESSAFKSGVGFGNSVGTFLSLLRHDTTQPRPSQ
jgi:hypothetical protein